MDNEESITGRKIDSRIMTKIWKKRKVWKKRKEWKKQKDMEEAQVYKKIPQP